MTFNVHEMDWKTSNYEEKLLQQLVDNVFFYLLNHERKLTENEYVQTTNFTCISSIKLVTIIGN